ncbi:MAG TPA: ferritin-like domain-containing protein [Candidatus Binatia bacterium]|nr:ferritin-like domain-containing protein [Candidatus Binatia bacterium]
MGTGSGYHEADSTLTDRTRDLHRALASLQEELEAIDWYQQRVDATTDPELAKILAHNRDEEKEHAAMVLEWIRRQDVKFDEVLREFLFQDGPIVGREAQVMGRNSQGSGSGAVAGATVGSLREGK